MGSSSLAEEFKLPLTPWTPASGCSLGLQKTEASIHWSCSHSRNWLFVHCFQGKIPSATGRRTVEIFSGAQPLHLLCISHHRSIPALGTVSENFPRHRPSDKSVNHSNELTDCCSSVLLLQYYSFHHQLMKSGLQCGLQSEGSTVFSRGTGTCACRVVFNVCLAASLWNDFTWQQIMARGWRAHPSNSRRELQSSRCHHCNGLQVSGPAAAAALKGSTKNKGTAPASFKAGLKLLMRPQCINTSLSESLKKRTKQLHFFFTILALTSLLAFSHLVAHLECLHPFLFWCNNKQKTNLE